MAAHPEHDDPHADLARARSGLIAAAFAYASWGLLPLYFRLLHHVDSVEIVAHRVLWSLALLGVMIAWRRELAGFLALLKRGRLLLSLAASAMLIAINWLVYIWAVNHDQVIAASLGYFLNPLVSVALGFVLLKERLRRVQTAAVVLAAVGVAILAFAALDTLWISLTLAVSFALYGLIRKFTPVTALHGLAMETLILSPLALGWLLFGAEKVAFGDDVPTTALLVLAGAITSVPLLLFGFAAPRLRLATLGLMQYLAPTMQFACGVLLFGEKLGPERLACFALIWVGLALFAADSVRALRTGRGG